MSTRTKNRHKHAPHARRVLVTTARNFGLFAPRTIKCACCDRVAEENDILTNHCQACADNAARQAHMENEACKHK